MQKGCVKVDTGQSLNCAEYKIEYLKDKLNAPFSHPMKHREETPVNRTTGAMRNFSTGENVKVASHSCVQLSVTPWTEARQAPLSMGFSRQEYWSGLPGDGLDHGLLYNATTSIHSSSGTLFIKSNPLNLFVKERQ